MNSRRIVYFALIAAFTLSLNVFGVFGNQPQVAKADCVPSANLASRKACQPGSDANLKARKASFVTNGRVVAAALNVRARPNAEAPIISHVQRGDKVSGVVRVYRDWVLIVFYDRESNRVRAGYVYDPIALSQPDTVVPDRAQ
ncbi:MAG: SH3 domain-containing protein [Anaerolineae bacterium]|nr:SH3 domain-containing protein [Anaerolineae bacterium]